MPYTRRSAALARRIALLVPERPLVPCSRLEYLRREPSRLDGCSYPLLFPTEAVAVLVGDDPRSVTREVISDSDVQRTVI